jgi:type I restriction enzyme S subunit
LQDIANVYQPKTITASLLSDDGEYPVYGANGIIGKYKEYNHVNSQICLTCRGNTCGTINYSLPFSWITGNSMVVNVDKHLDIVNKRYLYHLLSTIDYTPYISGSGQPQIVRCTIAKMPINLPDITHQISIASTLDTMIEIRSIEKSIQSLLFQQKKELLRSLFI